MEDSRTVEILTALLKKEGLTEAEKEAVRDAIGILAWTKLVEGMKERKKARRDLHLSDSDI